MISITKELCSIFCPKPDRVLQIYHLFLAPRPKAWQTDFLARLLIMICGLARERERERRLLEILNIWHYRSILPLKSFSLDLEWVVQKFLVKIKFRREQVLDKMKMDILSFLGEKVWCQGPINIKYLTLNITITIALDIVEYLWIRWISIQLIQRWQPQLVCGERFSVEDFNQFPVWWQQMIRQQPGFQLIFMKMIQKAIKKMAIDFWRHGQVTRIQSPWS